MTQQPLYQTDIIFDRESGDYAMYLDQELVGFARSQVDAAITLDALIADLLSGGQALDARIEQLAEQYSDAKTRGNTALARQIKRIALELTARKMGIAPAEFVAGYAAWKAA